jgi:thiopurine S-methyltransferase
VTHFSDLSLPEGSRVLLPLCGKTLDIHWLLSRRYRVAGSELSKLAVEQLFSELGVEPWGCSERCPRLAPLSVHRSAAS